MGKEIVVIVKEGQNVISSNAVTEGSGRPLVIKAKSHQSYELKNLAKGVAPDEIYVIRDGKNLKIKIGKKESNADDAADIIIEEYFEHDCNLIGVAENGQYYNYMPQGADPAASYYSLGGDTLVAESETDWLPIILGVLGAGAIAAAASGGGSDNPPPAEGDAPESLMIGVYDDNNDNDDTSDVQLVSTEVSTAAANPATGIPVTNDNTPTVKGHTEAGASVTITFKNSAGDEILTKTVTADSNGNYRFTPETALADGQYYVSAVATNAWGNSLPGSTGIFEIDTVAPDAPDLDPTDGSEVSGTAEAGSHITITDGNGNVIGETEADQNGSFSYTPADPIPDATVIEATATDAAGNESAPGTTTVDASIADAPTIYDDIPPIIGEVHNNDTTDDTQPDISGEAGSVPGNVTVEIYDNGSKIGETTSNADGSWSFTPGTPFPDGSVHSITYSKNGGTNQSPAVNFTIDTTPPGSVSAVVTDDVAPVTGVIADNGVTDDTTPTISGQTEAGATVTIKDGTTELGTVTADSNGNYTFTPTTPLAEGPHAISATAADAAGNSLDSATTNFTVDTTPPEFVTLVLTDDVDPITGEIADNGVTDDTTPTISGETEAGATVTIKDGNTVLGTVTADNNGNYTFTPTTPLVGGAHAISATASDAAGNSVDSATTNFTIQTTASDAAVAITGIADDTGIPGDYITSDSTLVFSGTNETLGNGEKVQISLDGGNTWMDVNQNTATEWSYDNRGNSMADGSYNVEARVIDAAGNVGSTDSQSVVVDTVAPTSAVAITGIAEDTGAAGDFITSDSTLVFSGTNGSLGSGEKVQISLDGGNTWMDATQTDATHWSYDNTSNTMTDGTYTVEARVIDAAGNVGSTDSQSVVVDTVAPTSAVAITGIAEDTGATGDFITSDSTLVFSGTNGSLGNGEKVQISLDGGNTWMDVNQTTATQWSYDNTSNTMTDGSYNVEARVIDAAGNVGNNDTQTVVVDTQAPTSITLKVTDDVAPITGTIADNGMTDDTTPTISGTTEAGATVTIKDGTVVLATVLADANGDYTFTPTTPLSEGPHAISATASDAAGNNVDSTTTNFTVDITAPNSVTVVVTDDVAPITGTIADNGVTDDTTPTISGKTEAGATVTIKDGTTVLGTTEADSSGNYTFTPTTPLGQGMHTISVTAADAAGNSVESTTTTIEVDTTSPTATITMDDPELTIGETSTVTIQFSEAVVGFASADDVTVENGTLSEMTTSDGGKTWTGTFTPTANIIDTTNVITLNDTYTDIAGNTGTTASTDYTIDTTPPPVIDLGDDGQLIHPVFVDGKYYYYWDRDGDGKGKTEGASDFDDVFRHDDQDGIAGLDTIFQYDENGNLRPDNLEDTTDTYRYTELGGYQIALPTYGAETDGVQNGTEIDNDPEGEINPYYDDLVAIWDAFNGGEQTTGTTGPGIPEGWSEGFYWSASQYPTGDNQENHYTMDLTNGLGGTNGDHDRYWVAVEVIF